jgi:hypothetical protein
LNDGRMRIKNNELGIEFILPNTKEGAINTLTKTKDNKIKLTPLSKTIHGLLEPTNKGLKKLLIEPHSIKKSNFGVGYDNVALHDYAKLANIELNQFDKEGKKKIINVPLKPKGQKPYKATIASGPLSMTDYLLMTQRPSTNESADAADYIDYLSLFAITEPKLKNIDERIAFVKQKAGGAIKSRLKSISNEDIVKAIENNMKKYGIQKGLGLRRGLRRGHTSWGHVPGPQIYTNINEVVARGKLLEAAIDAGNNNNAIKNELNQIYDYLYKNKKISRYMYQKAIKKYVPK